MLGDGMFYDEIDRKHVIIKDGREYYHADCGHDVRIYPGSELELKEYDGQIICNECFYKKAGEIIEKFPIGAANLTHP